MINSAQDVPKSVQWYLLRRNWSGPLSLAAIFWALTTVAFLAEKAGYELTRRGRTLTSSDLLVMATVVTSLVILYACPRYLRARRLAARGVPVTGTVRQVGGIVGAPGLERAQVTFTVESRARVVKLSTGGGMERGKVVQLIIDPARPKRCMFREDVLPDGHLLPGEAAA